MKRGPLINTSVRGAIAVIAVLSTAVAACDTGDGTRLQEPTTQTTVPPPDTAPLSSVAIDDQLGDVDPVPPGGDLELDDVELPPSSEPDFQLFAPWADGGSIDPRHTCDGSDLSPTLSWIGVPEGTVELALAVVDLTDLTSGRPLIHWVVGGLDPSLERLEEDATPPGALQGLNFFGDVGYTGPCPDPGQTHEYRITLYALGQQLEAIDSAPSGEILDQIDTVSIAAVSTSGTVTR